MGSASPLEDSLLSDNNILEPFDFDFVGIFGSQTGSISRSTSDIDITRNTKIDTKISEKVKDSTLEDSFSDIIFEPFDNDQKPSSGRWSKIVKTTSFAFPSSQSDLSYDLKGAQIMQCMALILQFQPLKKMINTILLHMIWEGRYLKNHTAWQKGNQA